MMMYVAQVTGHKDLRTVVLKKTRSKGLKESPTKLNAVSRSDNLMCFVDSEMKTLQYTILE